MSISQEIEKRLNENFEITTLRVIDESHKHEGHIGHKPEGETHFRIKMASPDFKRMSRIDRQRKIYHLLDDLLKTRIHALALELKDS